MCESDNQWLKEQILGALDRYGPGWLPLRALVSQIFGCGYSRSQHSQVAAAVRELKRERKVDRVKRSLVVVRLKDE